MNKKTKSLLQSNFPIVLASKSESRKNILLKSGLAFKQIASNIDEDVIKEKMKKNNNIDLAKKLAELKALELSKIYKKSYIIGADQICVHQNKIFNKPIYKKKALEQLIELNGKMHKQISAVTLCYDHKILWSYTETAIMKMRKLGKSTLKRYVDLDLPLNSCGSYKFEANGKYLFSRIRGNTSTILGLPIFPLLDVLLKKNVIGYA